MPVENCEVLRRVGWELAFWPAWRDWACRNSEEILAEQQHPSLIVPPVDFTVERERLPIVGQDDAAIVRERWCQRHFASWGPQLVRQPIGWLSLNGQGSVSPKRCGNVVACNDTTAREWLPILRDIAPSLPVLE